MNQRKGLAPTVITNKNGVITTVHRATKQKQSALRRIIPAVGTFADRQREKRIREMVTIGILKDSVLKRETLDRAPIDDLCAVSDILQAAPYASFRDGGLEDHLEFLLDIDDSHALNVISANRRMLFNRVYDGRSIVMDRGLPLLQRALDPENVGNGVVPNLAAHMLAFAKFPVLVHVNDPSQPTVQTTMGYDQASSYLAAVNDLPDRIQQLIVLPTLIAANDGDLLKSDAFIDGYLSLLDTFPGRDEEVIEFLKERGVQNMDPDAVRDYLDHRNAVQEGWL